MVLPRIEIEAAEKMVIDLRWLIASASSTEMGNFRVRKKRHFPACFPDSFLPI